MILDAWAARHAIPAAALAELRSLLVDVPDHSDVSFGSSEAAVQSQLRVVASAAGWRLWRNNIGAGRLENGSFVRWGLANDSTGVNQQVKSGDLIGIRPVVITADMIGQTLGQFVSREVKAAGWRYTGTAREQAQLRWIEIVTALGGDAKFTTGGI